MIFSPAAWSTRKESKQHLFSAGRTPEYVSWTSSRGSRCPFSKLSWSMAPMLSRSTKKRSSQVSPTQTSQLLWQRRVPPAAAPLSSRAQAALAAFVVLLVWAGSACAASCVPFPCPPAGLSVSCSFYLVCPVPQETLLLTQLSPPSPPPLSRVSSAQSHC